MLWEVISVALGETACQTLSMGSGLYNGQNWKLLEPHLVVSPPHSRQRLVNILNYYKYSH